MCVFSFRLPGTVPGAGLCTGDRADSTVDVPATDRFGHCPVFVCWVGWLGSADELRDNLLPGHLWAECVPRIDWVLRNWGTPTET